jgi:hypothetical protein
MASIYSLISGEIFPIVAIILKEFPVEVPERCKLPRGFLFNSVFYVSYA